MRALAIIKAAFKAKTQAGYAIVGPHENGKNNHSGSLKTDSFICVTASKPPFAWLSTRPRLRGQAKSGARQPSPEPLIAQSGYENIDCLRRSKNLRLASKWSVKAGQLGSYCKQGFGLVSSEPEGEPTKEGSFFTANERAVNASPQWRVFRVAVFTKAGVCSSQQVKWSCCHTRSNAAQPRM